MPPELLAALGRFTDVSPMKTTNKCEYLEKNVEINYVIKKREWALTQHENRDLRKIKVA